MVGSVGNAGYDQTAAAAEALVLRVSGGKPLHLRGRLLIEGSSRQGNGGAWHEIALYHEVAGRYAVAIRSCRPTPGDACVHRADCFASLDDAVSYLEAFDPSGDLAADIDAADPHTNAAAIALQAATLRQRMDAVTRQYRSLLGEMLYALDTRA